MLLSDLLILGVLPEDLRQSLSAGEVSYTLQGVCKDTESKTTDEVDARMNKSVRLAPDACLCFRHLQHRKEWRVNMKSFEQDYFNNVILTPPKASVDSPLGLFSHLTRKHLEQALVLMEDSWVCYSPSCSNTLAEGVEEGTENKQPQVSKESVVPDATLLAKSACLSSSMDTPNITSEAENSSVIPSGVCLKDLLASSEHRGLVLAIAHYLGPTPRSMKDVLNYILLRKPTSPDASSKLGNNTNDVVSNHFLVSFDSNRKYASQAQDVERVVNLLTYKGNCGGQLELVTEGYSLIDLDNYESKLTKQRVANRAFPRLSASPRNSTQYASQIRAMELYVDRDLFTRGRGIMSGLGTKLIPEKRARSNSIEDDAEDATCENLEINKYSKEEERLKTKMPVQYTDLSQCGINWESGDLGLLFSCSRSQLCEDLDFLKKRHASPAKPLQDSFKDSQLPSMLIKTANELDEALRVHQRLYESYQTLEKGMKSHSDVSHKARDWCDRIGPERRSSALTQQLKIWWERQQQMRKTWLPVYIQLQHEIYNLEREIMKYLDLCSLGVI